MSLSIFRAATLAVAALSLCAIAQAQWPARWNTSGTADDEGQCVAVDHRGNVFVAGKTKHYNTNWDIEVIKYGPTGSQLWEKHYDGTYGDDISTSIAVDWEGNVYVAGVSYGGATPSGTDDDFVVIKYDSSGNTVWPNSGTHTDYKFHNGALRLTDANKEGRHHSTNEYLCAMAMRDVAGSQPTFAITGPTLGANVSEWRTVVFEADATDGVKVKTGWPLDDLGDVNHDTPYGVGIHTDNTVYVVGGHHYSASPDFEEFTTIRYRASGTSGAGSKRIWTDTWYEDAGKPTEGRAIALDFDGNAFVTGIVLTQDDKDYGTRMILKDPDGSGDPIHGWAADAMYAGGGADVPTGISLSFEVELGVLNTYVHVTGRSQDGAIPGRIPYKIATIRYSGADGSQVWLDRAVDAGNDSAKPYVVAMGKGNVYVAGRKYLSSTNYDYVLRGLTKAGATRFSDYTYDSGISGHDEAFWAVMAGAGNVVLAGKSAASSTGIDFLTDQHLESDDPANLLSVSVNSGLSYDPGTDLDSVDSEYVTAASDDSAATFEVTFSGAIEPTEYSIVLDGHVSVSGLREKVEIWDGAWKLISDHPATTSDAPTVLPIKIDPQRYSTGHLDLVYVRVTYYGAEDSPWTAYLNRARLDQIQ
jgi:hypothetical protein